MREGGITSCLSFSYRTGNSGFLAVELLGPRHLYVFGIVNLSLLIKLKAFENEQKIVFVLKNDLHV